MISQTLSSLLPSQTFRLPKLMGILNITPDSFSDGGSFFSPQAALAHASSLIKDGADMVDIGAESTRPGAAVLSSDEEISRLAPILPLLEQAKIPFSIDTYKSETASFALAHHAAMINDTGGLQQDSNMASLIADHCQKSGACPEIILMQGLFKTPEKTPLKTQFEIFFEKSLSLAQKAGLPADKLLLDPGIGFGKTPAQNIETLRLIPFLKETYKLPVLIGLSKKRFLGRFSVLPDAPENRLTATLGADLFAALQGADFLRVHNPAEHRTLLTLFAELLNPAVSNTQKA